MSGARSELSLFEAAIESARVFNGVVAETAATSGLLSALHSFTTPGEAMSKMGFHSDKLGQFRALLEVLVERGLVEARVVGGERVYRTRPAAVRANRHLNGGIRPYHARLEMLSPWYGDEHVRLIRSSNLELLGADLRYFRQPDLRIRFDATCRDPVRTNLTNPLYEFGRLLAVRELVARGHRFLDLAAGLGYGAERLAQYRDGCEVVLVDRSTDFLREARQLVYPGARVRFIERDLNTGLPPLPAGHFDGILFNGAFHFIRDKEARLREMHRVLRPGGLLVIGHCFSRSGFEDEPMHNFYFSMIDLDCWPVPWGRLRSMVADQGFTELRQYHRGSHSYLLAERPADLSVAGGGPGLASRPDDPGS